MNETAKKLIFMSRGKQRYGTAGTTTTTTLASQGGLLINIDSATGDVARTTTGWIEDEKYGFYVTVVAGTVSAEFDTAVTRTGAKTLKLSTTNATGRINCNNTSAGTIPEQSKNGTPMKPSTKYKLSCWVKTNNVFTNSGALALTTYNSSATLLTSTFTNRLTGTNDWTLCTVTFTSDATTAFGRILWQNGNAGNVSDAWFDINSMTLEEVIEPVANSLITPSPSLVSFTAVGSTDNIDQSMLTTSGTSPLGNGTRNFFYQQFLPRKSKFTGVMVQRNFNSGTFTGNILVKIRDNNAGSPGSTVSASYTIPNATWNGLTGSTDYFVPLPCNLTIDGITTYWVEISATTSDAVNYTNINVNSANIYADGISRYSATDLSGFVTYTGDLYFKTLYYKPTTNFKASQNNQSVSISADEDGFLNGSVVNLVNGTATFTETFDTFYLLQYTISGSDLIAEINLPGVGLSASFTSDRTLEYSSDGVTYGSTFPTGFSKVWVKILAYSGFASFSYSIQFSNSGINVLKNYPTNKDIIKQYATTLGAPTTSATYRATKWGFPAIEYSATEYQYLDVDTTATGSTVAFSELGTTYTTVADGASLAISSTSTPNLFVKANITANRLYLSSNDTNASSDKDGSLRQTLTYNVIQ